MASLVTSVLWAASVHLSGWMSALCKALSFCVLLQFRPHPWLQMGVDTRAASCWDLHLVRCSLTRCALALSPHSPSGTWVLFFQT